LLAVTRQIELKFFVTKGRDGGAKVTSVTSCCSLVTTANLDQQIYSPGEEGRETLW
jgi:hypothetical protein